MSLSFVETCLGRLPPALSLRRTDEDEKKLLRDVAFAPPGGKAYVSPELANSPACQERFSLAARQCLERKIPTQFPKMITILI
ncbi:hypothetical protein D3C80_2096380 [compost metagenome]